ncbi:MAG: hypothetical protein IT384_33875 [Deltaproteobacteria bacterium]|nr:hypothetical protein [Deltaproteobacteria bacterium]
MLEDYRRALAEGYRASAHRAGISLQEGEEEVADQAMVTFTAMMLVCSVERESWRDPTGGAWYGLVEVNIAGCVRSVLEAETFRWDHLAAWRIWVAENAIGVLSRIAHSLDD